MRNLKLPFWYVIIPHRPRKWEPVPRRCRSLHTKGKLLAIAKNHATVIVNREYVKPRR